MRMSTTHAICLVAYRRRRASLETQFLDDIFDAAQYNTAIAPGIARICHARRRSSSTPLAPTPPAYRCFLFDLFPTPPARLMKDSAVDEADATQPLYTPRRPAHLPRARSSKYILFSRATFNYIICIL